ncbi:unnamed protein product [Absidia cylindrospora]
MAKFWTPVFESIFGYKSTVFVQWGDTLSEDCKRADLNLRLDLRITVDIGGPTLETVTGDAASRRGTTTGKLYGDRLKSVLATKCHLNRLIKYLQYIPLNKLKSIFVPIVQVMGMNCSVLAMSIIDKNVYAVQTISDMTYPRTLSEIRDNEIGKLVCSLQNVESMMEGLQQAINQFSNDTRNKMKMLTGGNKDPRPLLDLNEWTSEVIGIDELNKKDREDGHQEDGDDDDLI